MKRNYQLEGLDCASCAAQLEQAIGKIEGVKSVNINFMMQRMELEYDEKKEAEVMKKIKKAIKKEEPDVEIKEL